MSAYATLPATPNGAVAFAPDGTIYVEVGYLDPQRAGRTRSPARISRSRRSSRRSPDIWSIYWVNVGAALPDGSARSLIVLQTSARHGIGRSRRHHDGSGAATTLAHDIGAGTIGADGCLYTATADTVYRIAPDDRRVRFRDDESVAGAGADAATVTPNPTQGGVADADRDVPQHRGAGRHGRLFRGAAARTRRRISCAPDANGVATFAYQGASRGDDVDHRDAATIGDATLTSNVARVTWDRGTAHEPSSNITGPTTAHRGTDR